MKFAVIGLGGSGSAALRFLASAGHDTVGYEQFAVGHARGSSHGGSRIIRYLYPDPLYTNLIRAAYPLWQELQALASMELLVPTGGIFIGEANDPTIAETVASLDAAGCSYELLGAPEASERFSDFRFAAGEVALYQADTGFLRASDCVAANIRLALGAGADVREGVRIVDVSPNGAGRVRVVSESGEEVFDRVVVTAGPWMARFPATSGLPLTVTRQYVAYLGDTYAQTPPRFPAWVDVGSPETFYGVPNDGRLPGVKIAAHRFGPAADPDAVAEPVSPAELERICDYASTRFKTLAPVVCHTDACLYTVTPDQDFVVGEVASGVWVVSGCSGHGFKFTVLLGKIAADLATRGECNYDISRFSPSRFK